MYSKKILILLILTLYMFVSKSQTFQWASKFSGSFDNIAKAIKHDSNGDVVVAGKFLGTVDFDPSATVFNLSSAGSSDIFIVKLNSAGNLVWAKKIGGNLTDEALGLAIDANNNIYVTGIYASSTDFDPGIGTSTLNFSGGASDGFVLKLQSNGDFVWAKSIGGANLDICQSIDVDNAGNCFITGKFEGNVDFDPSASVYSLISSGTYDSFIEKLDASGNFSWAVKIGSAYNFENGWSIKIDGLNNVFASGALGATNVDIDPGTGVTLVSGGIYLIKLTNSGSFIWGKAYDASFAYGLTSDANGNVYSCGHFASTIDLDPGPGTYTVSPNSGSSDIYIQKLDALGNFIWAQQIGGQGFDRAYSISSDGAGNLVLCGEFSNIIDFDASAATYTLNSNSGKACIINLDANANFLWAGQLVYNNPNYVSSDNTGNLYYCSSFVGSGDLDATSGIATYTATGLGTADAFVSKIAINLVNGIHDQSIEYNSAIQVYPNPTSGDFFINAIYNSETIHIYNTLGQELAFTSLSSGEGLRIKLEQPNGIYFIRIGNSTKKIIKQ